MSDPQGLVGFDLGATPTAAAAAGGAAALGLDNGKLLYMPLTEEREPEMVDLHRGAVLALAASDAAGFVSGGEDGVMRRITPEARIEEIHAVKGAYVDAVAASQSGLLAAAFGKELVCADPAAEIARGMGPFPSTIASLAFSPDSATLAVAHYDGVSLWSPEKPEEQPTRIDWKGSNLTLAYAPDGSHLACANQEKVVKVMRLADLAASSLEGYSYKPKDVVFSADSRLLLTDAEEAFVAWPFPRVDDQGEAVVFGPREGSRLVKLVAHPKLPLALGGFMDGAIILADLKAGQALELYTRPGVEPTALAFTGVGLSFIGGFEDGFGFFFDLSALFRG